MGRVRDEIIAIPRSVKKLAGQARVGMVLGTGWNHKDVLAREGFTAEAEILFEELNIGLGSGVGHANRLLVGTWKGQPVAISSGRVHLNQVLTLMTRYESPGAWHYLRRWMCALLTLMGNERRLILTCSAGGLGPQNKQGMLLMPNRLISADLPTWAYLDPDAGEYVMSEDQIWLGEDGPDSESEREHPGVRAFTRACHAGNFSGRNHTVHRVIVGPGFGGAKERELWKNWGADSVGMSLDPELRLLALEQITSPEGNRPYRVMPVCYISDDVNRPDNNKILAAAQADAHKMGRFLSAALAVDW